MKRVIVIGGGVGGLTTAHELAERGFEVHLYDARPDWGGKARSQAVEGTGTDGRRDLPGEHGFRFYPRFYRHVIDTMARIPVAGGGNVSSQLRPCPEAALATVRSDTVQHFNRSSTVRPGDILDAMRILYRELGFDNPDLGMFGVKIMQFFSTSDERRLGEYERMSWWDFLEGDSYSDQCRKQLSEIPRMLVAMDAKQGNARTNGVISMQLVLDMATNGDSTDRTMGGPTSQMWIDPWTQHLRSLGVTLHADQQCVGLDVADGRVARARFAGGEIADGDHFVLAVPLDAVPPLMSEALCALDPQCEHLRTAPVDSLVSWMVGMQFYLYEDVPLARGHLFFPDAPWALTGISQPQFWRDTVGPFNRNYGPGDVSGLISIDISEWNSVGTFVKKRAVDCTPDEIKEEVWQQIKAGLNGSRDDQQVLTDRLLHSWHLDSDIDYSGGVPPVNRSRLLIHPPNSWALRPEPTSAIPNLCFAADYVRTTTDLASMEGACEAGRRATNAILDREKSEAPRAQLWKLEEPAIFDPWKKLDAELYRAGKPHILKTLGTKQAFQAADMFRRFSALAGLGQIDTLLSQFKIADTVSGFLGKFLSGR